MRLLIIGAGGHAQVVADILLLQQKAGLDIDPIGYLDDDPKLIDQFRLGLPILAPVNQIASYKDCAIIVGIGDNYVRRALYNLLMRDEVRAFVAAHPAATVASDVSIGEGTVIAAGVVVNTGSVIGQNVILNTACTIDHHNVISDHVHIAPGVNLGGGVQIGEASLIGVGATIMPQRCVGSNAIVGAGSVVVKNVADGTIVAGVPARMIGENSRD
ncbi:acetyltransferase [Candidatus Saccharibacteria bacterium]|nr:acetyltransferase [Candidatus Saccharibacteria bacterium]